MGENIFFILLMFFITIGVLVVFHEFGHFWVARKLGVKVLRFSVGFGHPIARWRRKNDETEYVLAPFPLGGYVKMLDEREAPVPEVDKHREFNAQPLWRRSAIILAGPLANLILAFIIYWLMFVLGVPGVKPVLGDIPPQTIAAEAGLQKHDEVIAVGNARTPTWASLRYALLNYIISQQSVQVTVKNRDSGEKRQLHLALDKLPPQSDPKVDLMLKAGITLIALPPIVKFVEPNSAAMRGGLQVGDRVVVIEGKPVDSWISWTTQIQNHVGVPMQMDVERHGQTVSLTVTPDVKIDGEKKYGFLGVKPRPYAPELKSVDQYPALPALAKAWDNCWQTSSITLKMLWKIASGQASLENLSGPVSIAKFAGYTASIGLTTFLSFLAMFSISLFIINLLPIPVLDGGHLLLFAAEWLKGKPVSEMVRIQFQTVGLVMIVLLMGVAIYYDIMRWFA